MTKKELVKAIACKHRLANPKTLESLTAIVSDVFEQVGKALSQGEKVQISGFGTFSVKESKARKGRNPRTGEEIDLPAHKRPCFTAGKTLKAVVRNLGGRDNVGHKIYKRRPEIVTGFAAGTKNNTF